MFFLWGGGKELFSIPYYNGTEKKVVFSTIYKVYYRIYSNKRPTSN